MKAESLKRGLESLSIEAREVCAIADYLDKRAFGTVVDAIVSAGKVVTCASGSSGIAAKKFAHTLCCVEQSAQFLPPCEAVHGGLGALKQTDVLVMVSRGGKTAELLPVANACKQRGAKLIMLTENLDGPLSRLADIVLPMKIGRESDKYNYMATSSFVVTVALFDAIISAVMEETDYKREMFAVIHPGGAVGEMLNKQRGGG
jgi:D-arabinose 5-phosphate isomerase GutQ